MKDLDNKGLSLVELIITMAICGFVSIAILAFLRSGSIFYTRINAEVELQMEAQTTYNQIRDNIMNTEVGAVSFGMPSSGFERNLKLGGKSYRALVLYNKDNIQAIIFDPGERSLYMVTEPRTALKYGDRSHILDCVKRTSNENILSKDVVEFNVDTTELNRANGEDKINVVITFEKRDRLYKCNSDIALRNATRLNPDQSFD